MTFATSWSAAVFVSVVIALGVIAVAKDHGAIAQAAPTPASPLKTPAQPVRLRIPTLHIDAPVDAGGLSGSGAVDAPSDPEHVAWFSGGPLPGEKGNAVMVGHSGWREDIPAVFDELATLRAGDSFSVADKEGGERTFVVRALQTFAKDATTTDIFYAKDDRAHLNLITCTGAWSARTQSYADRLVVFGDLRTP